MFPFPFAQPAFIQGIGGPELLIILVIILLLFGAKRLPELARGLGKSLREFKKATQDVQDDFKEAMDTVPPASADNAKVKSPPPAPANIDQKPDDN
jgi:sec-independent protein translocase protein TatA